MPLTLNIFVTLMFDVYECSNGLINIALFLNRECSTLFVGEVIDLQCELHNDYD